ncbi:MULTISPECIES: SDR family NAD(P)-dependent oxidoreductase [Streptomyces]|uniref:SDR family NAD(P)-dependent oxidoreductase n=1 Tax=Streptomyces TaxID=1883 RepID=UPI000D701C31|nr:MULTISPECIES: SDR family NAD(P)-dependent oxidoreductase [Streptomyces]AWN29857.1 3-oxoacyl-ACP reductase [Streptomyces sp. NEAU-S7GS2]MCX5448849.1 SDR family NAD(P)-dependent oxidoreductase [Streptomyces libani]
MPLPAYDLTGRTALVTGAASGIGRATATLLATAGATVHCADLDEQGAKATAAAITAAEGSAHAHRLDVTRRDQVAAVVDAARSATGRLDVMANIAGIMHSAPVLETEDADLDRVWNTNFKGVLYGCQEAARAMIATATPGSLVNMASGAIDTGAPGLLSYGAAKAAVVQLTKTLATEVGRHGIRVNAVAPGWIRTAMTDRHTAEAQQQAEGPMIRMSPLGRVGEPEDVAHTVLHLASDASSFMTGQVLRPNGGVAMPW